MLTPGETTHREIDQGWLLPEPEARNAIHTRSIVCRSFRRHDGLIEIDARFIDTRPFSYESDFRGACQAGSALHNMQMRVTFDISRHIVAVVSAMPSTPYAGCVDVNPNFQRLVGLSVGRGFRKAVRDRLGGVEGCTHVLALLDAVAAASMQAFASNGYAPRQPGEAPPPRVWKLAALVDSCWSYKADGEVMQLLQRRHGA
jgi:Protein of unknown function (DUF2889)